ncbi:MAG: DUF4258 domain-containing protein [Nitrospinae bacterium]|nr:DUF4258 domain-containing protein [Nitrospinota bacterium]
MAGTRHELSQHASDMLKERKIDLKWLEQAIDNPEFVEQDKYDIVLEHRFAA